MRKLEFTPGNIVLTLCLVASLPATFRYFRLGNGGEFPNLGFISGGFTFSLILLLVIEKVIIRTFKPAFKNILIIEMSIICLCLVVKGLDPSTIHVKVPNNCKWFAIFYSDNPTSIKTEYLFPNDKILKIIPNDIIFLSKSKLGQPKIQVEASKTNWNNYYQYDKEYNIGSKVYVSFYILSGDDPSDSVMTRVGSSLQENRLR